MISWKDLHGLIAVFFVLAIILIGFGLFVAYILAPALDTLPGLVRN